MSDYVIEIKIYQKYQLGVISSGTLAEDLSRIWSRYISKEEFEVCQYIMMIRKKL